MKTFSIVSLFGLLGLLWNPGRQKGISPEEACDRSDEENWKVAEKLVAGGAWLLSQPGSVTNDKGSQLNFNISPSPLSEFYSHGMFSGLGSLFSAGPYSEVSLGERSKLEWKGSLQVKFEWGIGPHIEGKWIPVCCDLVVMRFIKPPS